MKKILQNQKQKLRKWVVIIFIISAAVLLLPLPVPRIKTLHGECLRHGETAEIKMCCVELRFLLFRDRIYGNWEVQVGHDGEAIHYVSMPDYTVTHIPEEKMDYFFIKLHRYQQGESSYQVYVNDAWDKLLLSEHIFDVNEDEEHLLAVSSDGDIEAIITCFPPSLSE